MALGSGFGYGGSTLSSSFSNSINNKNSKLGSSVFGGSSGSSGSSRSSSIDLSKDYTSGGSSVFGGSSSSSSSSSSSNLSKTSLLKDRTGNNILTQNQTQKQKDDQEINLMKDYTINNFDPVNVKSNEQRLKDLINQRYPGSNTSKNLDLNNVPQNIELEEINSNQGYKYGNIDFLQKAKTDYIGMGYPEQTLQQISREASQYEQQNRKNPLLSGLIGGSIAGLKTGNIANVGPGAASGLIDGFINMMIGGTHTAEYEENKGKNIGEFYQNEPFIGMYGGTLEDYAEAPIVSDYQTAEGSVKQSYLDRYTSNAVNKSQNNDVSSDRTAAGAEKSVTGGSGGSGGSGNLFSDIGAGLLSLMYAGNQSAQNTAGSGSGGGTQTVNVIPASQQEEKQTNNYNSYLKYGLFGALVIGMIYLGGE
jgi:hypothetical protein